MLTQIDGLAILYLSVRIRINEFHVAAFADASKDKTNDFCQQHVGLFNFSSAKLLMVISFHFICPSNINIFEFFSRFFYIIAYLIKKRNQIDEKVVNLLTFGCMDGGFSREWIRVFFDCLRPFYTKIQFLFLFQQIMEIILVKNFLIC